MRKFTKSLLTLALFVLAVGVANAEKKYADLSKLVTVGGTNATWDGATNTITWIGQSNNMVSNFDFAAGDYSTWEKAVLKVTSIDNCIGVRIQIKANGKEKTKPFNGTGTIEVDLSSYGFDAGDLTKVEWIRMLGSGYYDGESHTINSDTPGSAVISEFYLERPDVVYLTEEEIFEAPAGTTDVNGMIGADSNPWAISYPKNVENETLFGGNIDGDDKSVDISSYDYLHFVVTSASADANCGLRVFVSTASSADNSTRVQLYPRPIADYADVTDWTEKYMITTPGTYVLKISDYPLLRGFKALQGWAGNAGMITVSQMYLSSGAAPVAYTPSGKTNLIGDAALADETVTCFNVTALSGSGRTLNAANPNALFIANDGTLANTKNVIVSGVCANLELVDGKPFNAPAAFTATNAKFTKTVSAAGYGTMVIPFDAALATGIDAAYNLTGNSGSKITSTTASSIAANKPVMVKAAAGNYEFTATGAAIAATVDESTNGKLIGTYVGTTAAAGANNYVLQNGAAGLGFFLVTGTDATVKPFRAYLNTAAAASMLSLDFDNLTSIDETELAKKAGNETFFNLAGQRVAQPAKGLYIVNGKKVIFK